MSKKPTTADERRHIGKVKSLPCSCCGVAGPSSAHHIRTGVGMGQKAKNWLVVALCYDCHQGPSGVHGDKSMLRIYGVSELDLLSKTIERLSI